MNLESVAQLQPLPFGGKLVEHRQPRLLLTLLAGQHICRQRPQMRALATARDRSFVEKLRGIRPRHLQDLRRLLPVGPLPQLT